MKKTILASLLFTATVFNFAQAEMAVIESQSSIDSAITITDEGMLNQEKLKNKYAPYFLEGRQQGKEATNTLRSMFKEKAITGSFMVKPLHVKAYVRIYDEKEGGFDTGSVMLADISPSHLVISKHYASEDLLISKRDVSKLDAGLMHEGTKLANQLGANTSSLTGVAVNLIANLAVELFNGEHASTEILNKPNTTATPDSCTEKCHHEVVFIVQYDKDPKSTYKVLLDKVNPKIESTQMTPLANLGLALVAEKMEAAIKSK